MHKLLLLPIFCITIVGCATNTSDNFSEGGRYALVRYKGFSGAQIEFQTESNEHCQILAKQWTGDEQFTKCFPAPYSVHSELSSNGIMTDSIYNEKTKFRIRSKSMCELISNSFKNEKSMTRFDCF